MKKETRKSISDKLSDWCIMSSNKSDFIEVTQWVNSDGFDITICTSNETKNISLTHGEIDAIVVLSKLVEKEEI